ncbi:MAG: choice-of-anchor D domain-containing protein [Bacteroidales bacterium]|nr:choice-of-anchor D domain-containing protein [Bacteroidales bacterium]
MKHIILILILLLSGLAARAENMVSVSSTSGHPQDEVTLQVSLANIDAAVAFQAEIPLGSQLTYVTGSVALNPDRVTDHQVSAAVVNGSLRIYAFSLSLTPFVGNEGDLLSFTLKLKNEPGDYALELNETKLSDAAGNALPVTTSNGMVTILSPKLQINTPNMNFGHVPIRSEYTQNASVTNVGNEPLVITGINFSNAVFSCPSFTETTLQPGGNAYFTFKFAPMQKGALTATATIVSNSIAGNGIINLIADPFAVNEIHIDYVTGYCDSVVEVPISMNNMEAIMGFQIDMNLPQALEYVDFTLSNRKVDHVSVGVFNEGLLRLMAYSASGSAFTGDDGVIGTLRLRLRGLYGNYYLNPSKAVLADANGEDALSAKYQGRVTIRSPKINGNNSLSFGSSPVTETVTREYVVRNQGNASMRIDQVVFDQSDFSVAETMPIVVEQYANTTLHVSYSREQKGDFSALMKIYSNDPQNGLKNVALSGSRYEPNDLELTADPFSLENGDVAVSLAMNNYSGIVALQANFQYPYEDYSVQSSDFQLTERFANHYLYAMPINDSIFRILILSLQNNSVDGHDGVVLNVTLHPIYAPSEEEYAVSVSDIVLSGVEGVNLYTGLFDPLAFVFFAVPVDFHFISDGVWSGISNWQYNTLPRSCDRVFIDANCQLDMTTEVAELTVSNGQSLTLQPDKTLTVTGDLTNTSTAGLVIKDGAQLINASGNVAATLEKDIVAYSNSNPDAWYTIASPMDEMPIEGSSFATPEFDLYRFNESNLTNEEWENYKGGLADFTTFENGRGYLFANSNAFSPAFTGILNASAVSCPLSFTERPNDPLSGFNLIGNPFPHDIYKGVGAAIDNVNLASGYYTLTNEGTWQVHTFEDAIHPGQGILVKATAPTVLTIAKSTATATAETGGAKRGTSPLSISVKGENGMDQTFVYIGRGNSMEKMVGFVAQEPSLWVRDNGKDYAIAHVEKAFESLELCFSSKQVGDFTLTVDRNETEFEYLQLVDHVTGLTVDLLKQQAYVFQAAGQEPEARFSIRFKVTE